MPREIKDWNKPRDEHKTLTPEHLMNILKNLYGDDLAEHLYEKLTKENTDSE